MMEIKENQQIVDETLQPLPATKYRSSSGYAKDGQPEPEVFTISKFKTEKESELTEKMTLATHEVYKLDTWREGNKYGAIIEGTYIIPCKTFLNHEKWQPYLRPDEKFKIEDLTAYLKERDMRLGLIIDLNRSYDYYDFPNIKENTPELSDTIHQKFLLENAALPDDTLLNQIYELLKKAHENKEVVAIHCFHGVNRTGYVICDFMCRYLGIDADTAIARFETARTHSIEHKIMTETLRKKYPRKENT